MENGKCVICKVFGLLVIIGALNWGAIGIAGINFVEKVLGAATAPTRIVYILVGVAGLVKLVSCFKGCPACKK